MDSICWICDIECPAFGYTQCDTGAYLELPFCFKIKFSEAPWKRLRFVEEVGKFGDKVAKAVVLEPILQGTALKAVAQVHTYFLLRCSRTVISNCFPVVKCKKAL